MTHTKNQGCLSQIHRGYYLRHIAIAQSVELFLQATAASPRTQILSLGAGFDTLFFRLLRRANTAGLAFVEIDCQPIVDAKREIVTRDAATFAELFTADAQRQEHTGNPHIALQCRVEPLRASYSLVACDLGDVARLEMLVRAAGLDRSLPTLVIAECVVVRVALPRCVLEVDLKRALSAYPMPMRALVVPGPSQGLDATPVALKVVRERHGGHLRPTRAGRPVRRDAAALLRRQGLRAARATGLPDRGRPLPPAL